MEMNGAETFDEFNKQVPPLGVTKREFEAFLTISRLLLGEISSYTQDQPVHRIKYDDGKTHWHDLAAETWRLSEQVSDPVARARAVLGQVCATRLQRREKAAMEAQAKKNDQLARIQTVIWESEYGFWLASNNDTWHAAIPINAY